MEEFIELNNYAFLCHSFYAFSDPHENDLVQLIIASDITSFSEGNRDNLQKQLALLLHSKDGGETNVHIRSLRSSHPHQYETPFFLFLSFCLLSFPFIHAREMLLT